jgi:hypothetical protein
MTLMLGKTYDALRSADGVSDQQAQDAAEEIAAFETRMLAMETRLSDVATKADLLHLKVDLQRFLVQAIVGMTAIFAFIVGLFRVFS